MKKLLLAALMIMTAVVIAFAFMPSAGTAGSGDAPLTAVLLTVSPNPTHPGEVVQFQWTGTGFHGTVTCHDNMGWLVNGGVSGSFTKTAGVHFTASFRWIVDCDDGDFFAQAYEDVLYVDAPPPPPPPGPPPPVEIIDNGSNLVTFRNQDGDWSIWKICSSVNGGPTVGPGYVARLVTPSPERYTVLDDWAGPPGGLNAMRGGLGAFGVHYARGVPPFSLDTSNAVADLTSRDCSSGGSQGVYQVDVVQAPYVSNGVGYFDLNVWLRDVWGNTGYGPDDPADADSIGDGGIKLTYVVKVYGSVVKHWATVTTFFAPNGAGIPFAKEPKFSGSLPNTTAGYKRIAVFGGSNGLTFIRAHTGNLPQGSRHSYDNNRLRVRYDFGTSLTDENGNCNGTVQPCLNVLFRATPPGGGWAFWEGSNAGLDKWATDVAGTTRVNAEDQPNVLKGNGLPYPWNCNATSDATAPFDKPEESTAYQDTRGWEFGGNSASADFSPYWNLMTLATAWEGGRGARDCDSTSMQFPAPGTSYSIEMDYSVDAGWSRPGGIQP